MKHLKTFFGRLAIVALLAVGAALPAKAQIYGAAPTSITNYTSTATNALANSLTYSFTNRYVFDLTQYKDYGVCISYSPTVTNAQTVTFNFKQSLDGTTNTETSYLTDWSIAGTNVNNTNVVIITTNFQVNGVGYLFLDKITSTLTNLIVGPGQTTNSFPQIWFSQKPIQPR